MVAPDGTIVAGTSDGVYALSAGGAVQWHASMAAVDAMALAPNGTLYASSGGDLVALNIASKTTRTVVEGFASTVWNVVIDASSVVYALDTMGSAVLAVSPDDTVLFRHESIALTAFGNHANAATLALGDHVLYLNTALSLTAIGP